MITFSEKSFQGLSLDEWYSISNLRERVFVVEQNCPYLDADGKDPGARHIMGCDSRNKIKAYARIVHPDDEVVPLDRFGYLGDHEKTTLIEMCENTDPGLKLPAIGRVVLDKPVRGTGVSHLLMDFTIQCAMGLYGDHPLFLSAQTPLHDFYVQHKFLQCGPGYLEDGIPHVPMLFMVNL